jgi:hypothetical protein
VLLTLPALTVVFGSQVVMQFNGRKSRGLRLRSG